MDMSHATQLPELSRLRGQNMSKSVQRLPRQRGSMIGGKTVEFSQQKQQHNSHTMSTQDVSLYDQRADHLVKAFQHKTENSLHDIRK